LPNLAPIIGPTGVYRAPGQRSVGAGGSVDSIVIGAERQAGWRARHAGGQADTTACGASARNHAAATFYHPDYTVGPGVSPDRGMLSDQRRVLPRRCQRVPSRAIPPIGNWARDKPALTLPRRSWSDLPHI